MLWARNIHKSYGPRSVLRGASLTIARSDRIGIVGSNGAGKTTLLRVLAGEPVDTGEVRALPGTRIGLLPQDLPAMAGAVWGAMLDAASEIQALRGRWSLLSEMLATMPDDQALLDEYGAVQLRLEHAGGYELETKAEEILGGVGIPRRLWTQAVGVLSGGERTRLNLARTLLPAPDLLLLDEPTNHLDLWAIEWLERFIDAFRGAVVVASHDRRLLDAVATRIVELDDGLTREYAGNFTAYRAARTAALAAQEDAYARHRQEVERVRQFVREQMARAARVQAGAKRGRDHYGRVARKMAKRAQVAQKRLERMDAAAPSRPIRPDTVHLGLSAGERGGPAVAVLRGVAKQFDGRTLLEEVNLTVRRGDRIGLVGPNGSGKTTLLQMLARETPPSGGEIWISPGARVGVLTQHGEPAQGRRRVLDVALDLGLSMTEARAVLGSLLFRGDRVFQPVSTLSGGERTRLALLELIGTRTNVLLLDEPTNHLDLPSRERFEEALEAYDGTLVVSSHDRFLLERLCTTIWSIEGGTVRAFAGGYAEFRSKTGTFQRLRRLMSRTDG